LWIYFLGQTSSNVCHLHLFNANYTETELLLVQVAERQGKYLASLLNRIGKAGGGHANSAKDADLGDPFVYRHLGQMATIGRYKALVDLRQSKVTVSFHSCKPYFVLPYEAKVLQRCLEQFRNLLKIL